MNTPAGQVGAITQEGGLIKSVESTNTDLLIEHLARIVNVTEQLEARTLSNVNRLLGHEPQPDNARPSAGEGAGAIGQLAELAGNIEDLVNSITHSIDRLDRL